MSSIDIQFQTIENKTTPTYIITLVGKFDETNISVKAPEIDNFISENVTAGSAVIFDVTSLSYINSKGIGSFSEWYMTLESQNTRMIISGMSEEMRTIFDIVSLLDIFETYDNNNLALDSIS